MELSKEVLEKIEQLKLDGIELSEEELDNVAGGGSECGLKPTHERVGFKTKEEVQFLYGVGEILHCYFLSNRSASIKDLTTERVAKVTEHCYLYYGTWNRFIDKYKVETVEGEKITGYIARDFIIK